MKTLAGGVTAPLGFLAAGIATGIKKRGIPDLALLVSERAGPIAGLFTRNRLPAAPVVLDRLHLRHRTGRAIIINSGNANACTGPRGHADAEEMARLAARGLDARPRTVFVGSTGVIGQPLPMSCIRRGLPVLLQRLRRSGGREAARAIMTTDQRIKEVAVRDRIAGRLVTVGGMAKGAGMIHPDMATMLAYLSTDAAIAQSALQQSLRHAVNRSFNCISVDGDTSTNDTVIALANGLAGHTPLRVGSRDHRRFTVVLGELLDELGRLIVLDGEGATRCVEIMVRGARSAADARRVARAIGDSTLTKAAFHGGDPNWGRILCAAGYAGAALDPERCRVWIGRVPVARGGRGCGNETAAARVMRDSEFRVTVDLGLGRGTARMRTTDLSPAYVRFNAAYST